MTDEYVEKWLKKADNDLKVAQNELKVPSKPRITENRIISHAGLFSVRAKPQEA